MIQKTMAARGLFGAVAFCLFFSCTPKKTEPSKTAQNAAAEQNITVTATFYPLYIMLLNIAADIPGVSTALLAPSETGCLHDYQLTTKDMLLLEKSDIIIANGAGMESFIEKILDTRNDRIIIASEGADLIYEKNGRGEMEANPHIWVSVDGAEHETRRIAEGLERLDPANAEQYRKNAESYLARLSALKNTMKTELAPFKGSRIITFHEAFPYFAREFGFTIAGIIEREPGTEPTAKELLQIISFIKDTQKQGEAATLFAEPQYTPSAAKIIANETGLTVYELDPAVTGSSDKDAYITAMLKNIQTLKQALENNAQ